MGPKSGPVLFITLVLCFKTGFSYMEALAAHADAAMNKFEPEVSFFCHKPAMHRVVNGWEPDFTTDCLEDPAEILEYCKKVYPDHDIKNVIETSYKLEIPAWPKFNGPDDKKTHMKVSPFRCLVGDFESEALLVPQHCIFDHEHDSNKCERPSVWKKTATDECASRGMVLESSGMLVVCGTDTFRGVEYVCCPKEDKSTPSVSSSSSESENVDSEEEVDDYTAYLRGYDMNKYSNEHMKFKAAEKSMQKHQHEKVTKMMKDWQEAREQVAEMRKTNKTAAELLNKKITEKFQEMYHAFEEEGKSEKKQLVSLHQQKVQAMFNRKKNILRKEYMEELEDDHPRTSKILSYLQQYIRVEEKDRLHTVNRYEHLRDTDPQEALRVRESLVKHLMLINERIESAIDMTKRDPELEKKIRPVIEEFRRTKFRSLDISIDDVVMTPEKKIETIPVDNVIDSAESDSESHDYTNIRIDTEGMTMQENNDPLAVHIQNNAVAMEKNNPNFVGTATGSAATTTNVVGIVVGSVAVLIIIVVAVVMMRKRSRRQPITHGFVEVDPAASPEERHVANMQMNGYENPTYRYFEMGTN
ncbi:amyloid-beta precursor-like protein [Ruditapes philippinarum]|uniref:amyloid-beta precursor-like protein n=1 Tax=Ruditapes philippinarum TaxID=129788 RepID=UPI00295AB661|nr:amyloid-beta precursor-like protein [Ruditapes philippinarum]